MEEKQEIKNKKKQRREDEAGKQERRVHIIIILYARERESEQEDPSHQVQYIFGLASYFRRFSEDKYERGPNLDRRWYEREPTLPEQRKRAGEKCSCTHEDNLTCD